MNHETGKVEVVQYQQAGPQQVSLLVHHQAGLVEVPKQPPGVTNTSNQKQSSDAVVKKTVAGGATKSGGNIAVTGTQPKLKSVLKEQSNQTQNKHKGEDKNKELEKNAMKGFFNIRAMLEAPTELKTRIEENQPDVVAGSDETGPKSDQKATTAGKGPDIMVTLKKPLPPFRRPTSIPVRELLALKRGKEQAKKSSESVDQIKLKLKRKKRMVKKETAKEEMLKKGNHKDYKELEAAITLKAMADTPVSPPSQAASKVSCQSTAG